MPFLESTIWKVFTPPLQEHMDDKSPKLLATPSQSRLPMSKFVLPSSDYSSSSSSSSASLASMFWQSPPLPLSSHWSPKKYIPARYRGKVTKRQVVVLVCLMFAFLFWIVPPPPVWRNRVVHITLPQLTASPYTALGPVSTFAGANAPNPLQWLNQNSNNKHSTSAKSKLLSYIPSIRKSSTKPRAALISLVRNSELPGLMQSMRQLEYHWNRKYQYPWVFFNDEPFSDEFKVNYSRVGITIC